MADGMEEVAVSAAAGGGIPWGSLISAGAGILGDFMSQSGQEAQNAFQERMANENMAWQERMSDTQMQRRVTDLKAAGLNPLLATGTSGASMGSPVMPNTANPAAAFQNLGAQVNSAMQLNTQQAQIDLMKSQANQASTQAAVNQYEAQTKMPAEVQKIAADTGVSLVQAQQINQNIKYLAAQVQNVDADTALKNFQARIASMNADVLAGSVAALININLDSSKMADYGLNLGETESKWFGSLAGKAAWMASQVLHPVQTAVGTYNAIDPQSGGSGMTTQQQNNYIGR